MSSHLSIPGEVLSLPNIGTVAPTGAVGIHLTALPGAMKPSSFLVTAVVTSAPSDLFIWGCAPDGDPGDETDDRWGVINDKFGRVVAGKLGTALAVGTHHFIVDDIGIFHRLSFTKSAGAVDVYVAPIYFSRRGN